MQTEKDAQGEQTPQPVQAEEVKPVFPDHKLAALGRIGIMWRAPFGYDGGRHYFREQSPEFYAGYSLWTKSVLPTNEQLIRWKISQGENGPVISLAAKSYGTMFHYFVARHEDRNDEYQFKMHGPAASEWLEYIRTQVATLGLPVLYVEDWERKFRNDMLAYFNWKREHQVNVLAIEAPVYSDEFRIATPVDMVCECLVKETPYAKKPTKKVVAAVDFKTGENGVDYDEYKLQLMFIKHAWNERFAETPYAMTGIFNWAPKKRSMSNGGFHFVNQDGRFSERQFLHYAAGCEIHEINKPTGKVLVYKDGPDGPELDTVDPYTWLRLFFGTELPM